MFFYLMDKKTKIMLIVSLILVIFAGVYFFILSDSEEIPEDNKGITIVEKEDTQQLTPIIVDDDRDSQSEAVKRYQMKVNRIIDKTNTLDYIVTVGVGESAQESMITVNGSTIFYDSEKKSTGGPNLVEEGMDIVFIGSGSPQIKDMKASVIIVGGSPNIKYSSIVSVNKDGDTGGYIYGLGTNNEYLAVDEGSVVRNGMTSSVMSDMRTITEGSGIIYTVKPEFTQQSFGLLYEAEELVLVSNPQE